MERGGFGQGPGCGLGGAGNAGSRTWLGLLLAWGCCPISVWPGYISSYGYGTVVLEDCVNSALGTICNVCSVPWGTFVWVLTGQGVCWDGSGAQGQYLPQGGHDTFNGTYANMENRFSFAMCFEPGSICPENWGPQWGRGGEKGETCPLSINWNAPYQGRIVRPLQVVPGAPSWPLSKGMS